MSWLASFQQFTNDVVRQVQLFMLCRQLGVVLSSIVVAWYLPVETVGTLEMLMFAGYLMTFFWSEALLRGYLANQELKEDPKAVTSFFMLFFLGSLASMLILFLGQTFLIPLFTSRTHLDGLELFMLYQVLVTPLWIAPFTGLLKGQNITLASVYVGIGPAFATWTGYTSLPGLSGILLGLFCYALVGFIWTITNTRSVRSVQPIRVFRMIWPATWPLILYALSSGLARSFDAWLVARTFSDEIFAIFRYGVREFPLVVAFAGALSTIMIPKLADNLSLPELRRRSTRIMHSSYPLIGLLILASPSLFAFLFGEAYRPGAFIFNIYLLLALTQLIFPQSILTARGDTRILWYVSLLELGVNIILSLILLQVMGLPGIAFGTLIAFTFEKIVLLVIVNKRYHIRSAEIMNVRVWMMYALFLSIIYLISIWVFGI
jgi:O-antigen/teichoic acid export membrane protein